MVVRYTSPTTPESIAAFAARSLAGEPIVIPGDPDRVRDFLFADDAIVALEAIVAERRWDETLDLASGVATPLIHAAELVREAVGSDTPIETPGGTLPPGENDSYETDPSAQRLDAPIRALEETIPLYVDWLRRHSAAQGRPGA